MSALTPLWSAGHIPLKGGDRLSPGVSQIFGAAGGGGAFELPISPLEGEMAGWPEGGVQAPTGR
ncbi:lytic murein transglycosylase [Mesorhizobium sp. B2-3-2]|nr:lytic murein transglycosylase [Mesorhizobium sp. B2-3-2]